MQSTLLKDEDAEKSMHIAELAGMILLENGAEMSRVEDTAMRILSASGYEESDVIALPTGLFLTVRKDGNVIASSLRRVMSRTVNLYKVCEANNISRLYVRGSIESDEALHYLQMLDKAEIKINMLLYAAISAGAVFAFAMLFRSSWEQCAISAVCGFFSGLVMAIMKRFGANTFMSSFIGGFITAVLAIMGTHFFGVTGVDLIISSTIMPLLPGLALTNSMRDMMFGDLVSGTVRLMEVLITAVSIAFGAGIVVIIYMMMGGAV